MPHIQQKKSSKQKNIQTKKKTAQELVTQLIKFKENSVPYNMGYTEDITPNNWWSCIDDPPNHLKYLAKKLFSIIPHSASCERIWSICGWIYGNDRTNLSIHHIEGMVKIHNWYISNMSDELKYINELISEEEMMELYQRSQVLDHEDNNNFEEDIEEDDNNEYIDNNLEVFVIIEPHQFHNNNILEETNEDEESDEENDESEEEYDPRQLASELIAKFNSGN